MLFGELDKSGFYQLLERHQDTQFGMAPGQTALEVDGVGGGG